jgi:hypothetical protein
MRSQTRWRGGWMKTASPMTPIAEKNWSRGIRSAPRPPKQFIAWSGGEGQKHESEDEEIRSLEGPERRKFQRADGIARESVVGYEGAENGERGKESDSAKSSGEKRFLQARSMFFELCGGGNGGSVRLVHLSLLSIRQDSPTGKKIECLAGYRAGIAAYLPAFTHSRSALWPD